MTTCGSKRLLIDTHLGAHVKGAFYNLDVKRIVREAADCGIEVLLQQAKCHWGNAYYNTRVGFKHPGLGKSDLIGELSKECKKTGIEFELYYSLVWDWHVVKTHPEWAALDHEGKIRGSALAAPAWLTVCFNTGYRQYMLAQIRELVENYESAHRRG